MRPLAVTAAAIALGIALFAALPSPAAAGDKDCADFASQRAAQIFFLKHGGPRYDPDRLDGDDDGVAPRPLFGETNRSSEARPRLRRGSRAAR